MSVLRQLQTGGRLTIPKGMLKAIGAKAGDPILIEYMEDARTGAPELQISVWKGRDDETE